MHLVCLQCLHNGVPSMACQFHGKCFNRLTNRYKNINVVIYFVNIIDIGAKKKNRSNKIISWIMVHQQCTAMLHCLLLHLFAFRTVFVQCALLWLVSLAYSMCDARPHSTKQAERNMNSTSRVKRAMMFIQISNNTIYVHGYCALQAE